MDKEFFEMNFNKAEEVQPRAVKMGEWYIWESSGYGYPPTMAFRVERVDVDTLYGFAHPNLNWGGNGRSPYAQSFPIEYCHRNQTYTRQSRLYRAVQQPKLDWHVWEDNLNALATSSGAKTGTDPEIFAEDAAGNIIPAWEFLPSKAGQRDALGRFLPGLFWDGFQAEFTVTPGSCQDGVGNGILARLEQLQNILTRKFPGARLSTRSVVDIPPGLMRSATSAQVDFGCRPSLNAYGLTGEVIADPRDLPIRFAGGHIHWGLTGYSEAQLAEAVKFVDLVAGLIGVSIFEGLDDPRRRRYYGLAGEFRLPPHGVEYRTLSNAWLLYPAVYHLLFTTGRLALQLGLAGRRKEMSKVPEIAVVNAINNTDVELARQLISEDERLFKAIFRTHWPNWADQTFAKVLTPVTSWGLDLTRIVDNWAATSKSGYRQRWYDFISGERFDLDKPKSTTKSIAVPYVPGDAVNLRPTEPRA